MLAKEGTRLTTRFLAIFEQLYKEFSKYLSPDEAAVLAAEYAMKIAATERS